MNRFWQLLAESVIFQGLLALIVVGATVYLLFLGREVPKELWGLLGLILGYYFGTKGQQTIQAFVRSRQID